jgi:hypothetical protein
VDTFASAKGQSVTATAVLGSFQTIPQMPFAMLMVMWSFRIRRSPSRLIWTWWSVICEMNNETPIRQGRRFRHYGEDLETVRKISATFLDRSVFIGAFFEDELIGFAKLVSDEDRSQAGLMHILSMIRHRDKAPTNALVAQAVRSCAERAIQYLWYVNFSYGKKQHDSLAEFKRRNGFQKVEIPRYYVPLTFAGRVAISLGLHHTVLDWVPEPAAALYRRLRSQWYARKYPGLENA